MNNTGWNLAGFYTMGCRTMLMFTLVQGSSVQTSYDVTVHRVSAVQYGDSMSSFPVRSLLSCVTSCATTADCRSVLYDPSTRLCQMNRERANLAMISSSCGPTCPLKYAEKMCSFGESCVVDADCVGNARAMCVDGICACETGYSIHETKCDCVAECNPYGTTFSVLAGTKMNGNNQRRIIGIGLSACLTECINEQNFICKTMDYRSDDETCNLQDFTVLEKPSIHVPSPNHDLYVRNCA